MADGSKSWTTSKLVSPLNNSLSDATKSGSIRIFIVEDSDVTRSALRAILGQEPDFTLVGEAVDGVTAVGRLMAVQPHVVLVDIGLPGASGVDVTRQFKERAAQIKALMFTANENERLMLEAFTAGADGYMSKTGFDKETLIKAIKVVTSGKCWLDPDIGSRILKFAKTFRQTLPQSVAAKIEPLSAQEEKVLGTIDGVCPVDPSFFTKLNRFSNLEK